MERVEEPANLRKHGLSFETAQFAFDDLLATTMRDRTSDREERWHTMGTAGGLLLLVVHTFRQRGNGEVIRIISARRASPREKKSHEENDQETI
jgi:uncharacterized DUF497 family protein